jgi:hypothetical protein
MKVVSPFASVAGLKLRVEIEVPAEKDEQQASPDYSHPSIQQGFEVCSLAAPGDRDFCMRRGRANIDDDSLHSVVVGTTTRPPATVGRDRSLPELHVASCRRMIRLIQNEHPDLAGSAAGEASPGRCRSESESPGACAWCHDRARAQA